MNVVLSFFNLKVELLIEGMKGAICCVDYKFHEERGYNDVYFDQVQTDRQTDKCFNPVQSTPLSHTLRYQMKMKMLKF